MKHLLIAAHGSRRESSNEEVKQLGVKVSAMLGMANSQVDVAFLEFASPSIENALLGLFNDKVTEVLVLPYFLSAGNHVVRDIPEEISKVLAQWPDKKITLLPHIGALDSMVGAIAGAFAGAFELAP
jgi:sirohydrochlorin ferrochelatase